MVVMKKVSSFIFAASLEWTSHFEAAKAGDGDDDVFVANKSFVCPYSSFTKSPLGISCSTKDPKELNLNTKYVMCRTVDTFTKYH